MARRFPNYNRRAGYIIGSELARDNFLPVAAQPFAVLPAAPVPAAPAPAFPAPSAVVAPLPTLDLSPEEEAIMAEDYSQEWREALATIWYRKTVEERVPLQPAAIKVIVDRWKTPGALVRELQSMDMDALRSEIASMDTRDPEWVRDWWRNNIGPDRALAIIHFVFRGAPRGILKLLAHYGEEHLIPLLSIKSVSIFSSFIIHFIKVFFFTGRVTVVEELSASVPVKNKDLKNKIFLFYLFVHLFFK